MKKKFSSEERKGQIIQTALYLFKEKGYENTTVNNIIDAAGISKGGFYHHYSSKEELLEDLAQIFLAKIAKIIDDIASREDLSALEKTNEYLEQVNSLKQEKSTEVMAFLAEMYAGGKNKQLENLIFDYGQKMVAPIMKSIIVQGIEEGEFKTDYPEEAAEMFVRLFILHQREVSQSYVELVNAKNHEELQDILTALKRKYMFLQKVLEDVLGLERGKLAIEKVAEEVLENMGSKIFGSSNKIE